MRRIDLDQAVSYAIKRVQAALRSALDVELRELGLTVPQYSCLEQLSVHPGRSNADLARGAFVSRQAMHQLLQGLLRDGLVRTSGDARHARYRCTAAGERLAGTASRAVAMIEDRMLGALSADERDALLAGLNTCADTLGQVAVPTPS